MGTKADFLRHASPNEQRTITRENLNLYHAVTVGAIYTFDTTMNLQTRGSFFGPLKQCIETHVWLTVVPSGCQKDRSFYERVSTIDLTQHIILIETDGKSTGSTTDRIQDVLSSTLDTPFPPGLPPWKLLIAPITPQKCFIAFTYSHTIGDGPTGKIFHKTFLDALNEYPSSPISSALITTPRKPLPTPFDTSTTLPISWSFLLGPLLATFLPGPLSRLLGFETHNAIDAGTWTGPATRLPESGPRSRAQVHSIPALELSKALQEARRHDAKLTAVFTLLVVRALSTHLPTAVLSETTNFMAVIPTNMRPAAGIPEDSMGNAISALSTRLPVAVSAAADSATTLDDTFWADAADLTQQLAQSAATLQDQAIGLLRYLPSMRKWMLGNLGQRRDSSFEVSNIGVLSPALGGEGAGARARIEELVFTQPGHVLGPLLAFNLGSVRGGALWYTVTWQAGALGLAGGEQEEKRIVSEACEMVKRELMALG